MSTLLQKHCVVEVKAIDRERKRVTALASTSSLDRDDESQQRQRASQRRRDRQEQPLGETTPGAAGSRPCSASVAGRLGRDRSRRHAIIIRGLWGGGIDRRTLRAAPLERSGRGTPYPLSRRAGEGDEGLRASTIAAITESVSRKTSWFQNLNTR